MQNLTAYRKPTIWKHVLAILISLTFMIVWLPFIRSIFDGESYPWGTEYFGILFYGNGVTRDFIFVVLQFTFYAVLMYSIYWIRNRTIFHGLLALWYVNVFGNLLFDIVKNGDTMFHGETLNVHLSITWIVIPLSVIALWIVAMVIRDDVRAGEIQWKWTPRNTRMLLLILGPLPIQAFLFATGETDGMTDQIGVILSIAQCFLLPFIYTPHLSEKVTLNTAE